MKKTDAKYIRLIAAGILVMNIGTVINYFVRINIDIVDFFKGFGIALALGAFWLAAKQRRTNQF
ncbi:MAG TPA: hypothetical protein PKE06_07120 [Flavilitoribacter sp.]|nr:hypothetical protein [Flavilitoribacter sp.]HMQ88099.1 hypothetical protein [Flavilitoribacter sp.]